MNFYLAGLLAHLRTKFLLLHRPLRPARRTAFPEVLGKRNCPIPPSPALMADAKLCSAKCFGGTFDTYVGPLSKLWSLEIPAIDVCDQALMALCFRLTCWPRSSIPGALDIVYYSSIQIPSSAM